MKQAARRASRREKEECEAREAAAVEVRRREEAEELEGFSWPDFAEELERAKAEEQSLAGGEGVGLGLEQGGLQEFEQLLLGNNGSNFGSSSSSSSSSRLFGTASTSSAGGGPGGNIISNNSTAVAAALASLGEVNRGPAAASSASCSSVSCPSGQVLKGGGSAVDHVLQRTSLATAGLLNGTGLAGVQGGQQGEGEDPGGWLEGLLAPRQASKSGGGGGNGKAKCKPKNNRKKR
jgi:hypothetical protein